MLIHDVDRYRRVERLVGVTVRRHHGVLELDGHRRQLGVDADRGVAFAHCHFGHASLRVPDQTKGERVPARRQAQSVPSRRVGDGLGLRMLTDAGFNDCAGEWLIVRSNRAGDGDLLRAHGLERQKYCGKESQRCVAHELAWLKVP